MIKRVNVKTNTEIRNIATPVYSSKQNITMNTKDIRTCLMKGAYVYEIFEDGSTLRLDLNNYNKENVSPNANAPKVVEPVVISNPAAEEIPVISQEPVVVEEPAVVEEAPVEEVTEEVVTEEPAVEEAPVEETVSEEPAVVEEVTEEAPVEEVVAEEPAVEEAPAKATNNSNKKKRK